MGPLAAAAPAALAAAPEIGAGLGLSGAAGVGLADMALAPMAASMMPEIGAGLGGGLMGGMSSMGGPALAGGLGTAGIDMAGPTGLMGMMSTNGGPMAAGNAAALTAPGSSKAMDIMKMLQYMNMVGKGANTFMAKPGVPMPSMAGGGMAGGGQGNMMRPKGGTYTRSPMQRRNPFT